MSTIIYSDMTLDLDSRIRRGEFNDKLPSTRRLAVEYKVSCQTINTALKPHLRSGLLTSEGRNGMKIHPENLKTGTVAVVGWNSPDMNMENVSYKFLFDKIREDGFSYALMAFQTRDISEKQIKLLFEFDAVIFTSIVFSQINIIEQLEKKGIPFVSCGFCFSWPNLDFVEFDSLQTLEELTGKIAAAGYRKIGLWYPSLTYEVDSMMRRRWHRIKKTFGLLRVAGDDIRYTGELDDKTLPQYLNHMKKRNNWPEAIIFWHPLRKYHMVQINEWLKFVPESTLLVARQRTLTEEYFPEHFVQFTYPDHSEYFLTAWNILKQRMLTPEIPPIQKWLKQALILRNEIKPRRQKNEYPTQT